MTVNAADPVDQNMPFSSLITVTNTGFLPLNAVTATMGFHQLSGMGPKNLTLVGDSGPEYGSRFSTNASQPHDLGLDDKFTFGLNEITSSGKENLRDADIAIVIDYEIPILHWGWEKDIPLAA